MLFFAKKAGVPIPSFIENSPLPIIPGMIRHKDVMLIWSLRKFIIGKIINTLVKNHPAILALRISFKACKALDQALEEGVDPK